MCGSDNIAVRAGELHLTPPRSAANVLLPAPERRRMNKARAARAANVLCAYAMT